jgi:aspartyl-tRNA(Asn)/glutamyl-tRNA(Gln) amidotransferase subunit C
VWAGARKQGSRGANYASKREFLNYNIALTFCFQPIFRHFRAFADKLPNGAKLKMSLDTEAVQRIALLARIEVTEAELAAMRDQLNGILAMIERMQAVDTTRVEPMAHAQDMVLRLREDKVTEANEREVFQSLAPQTEDGLYLVPRVID